MSLRVAGSWLAGLATVCVTGLLPTPASARPGLSARPIQLVLPLVADTAGLERFAQAVSSPTSPDYGRYESIASLSRRFGAPEDVRRRVSAYLYRVGATNVRIDRTGLFADATLPASRARRIFAGQTHTARAARTGALAAVPSALHGLITGVVGLNTRPLVSGTMRTRPAGPGQLAQIAGQPSSAEPRTGTPDPAACPGGTTAGEVAGDPATAGFTPNQYLTAYGLDALHSVGLRGRGERVALIEIDGFRYADIKAFAGCFHLDVPKINGFGVGVGHHPLAPGGETTLDLELLDAAAPDLKAIDVYEARSNAASALIALTAPLQNPGYRPQVISASLGLCERELYYAVGAGGLRNSEAALAMAAATGITFVAASGDQGSADCTDSGGSPVHQLAVNYPASSPWVTGVGGTNFELSPANQITRQLVWNDKSKAPTDAGGGGRSDLFYRPYYQRGSVRTNRRAVPDVSMLADIFPGLAIYCTAARDCKPHRPWRAVGGTSAGTPLVAGGLALVDQQMRAHRRQDLGLVNPLLYRLGRSSRRRQVFSDVLHYGNDVGVDISKYSRPLGCCSAGLGFDLASGWGSLNISGFASAAVSLQPPVERLSLPRHQQPVASHRILATVSCAGTCRMAAIAEVTVGHGRPFAIASKAYRLPAAGGKTVPVPFSAGQLTRLRSGLSSHERIVAEVAAVTVDAHQRILSQTTPKRLSITD